MRCMGSGLLALGSVLISLNTYAWRSQLYPMNWELGHTVNGVSLQDYSYAGYKNGEKAIGSEPQGAIYNVQTYGARTDSSDSTAAFQRAIDAASAQGKGVVYIPQGRYRLDGRLIIQSSGIILRGESNLKSELFFTKARGMGRDSHIYFSPRNYSLSERIPLQSDGVLYKNFITVDKVHLSKFKIGDDIQIGWKLSDAFINEHSMRGVWDKQSGYKNDVVFFYREVSKIETTGSTIKISFKEPLRYPAKKRDEAFVKVETGLLSNCGIEKLKVSNAVHHQDAVNGDNMGSSIIELNRVKDSWINRVKSFESGFPNSDNKHLQSNGITVSSSKRVTIDNSRMEEPQNRRNGGNGYLFRIIHSNEVLIQNSHANEGRHNFSLVGSFGNSGHVFRKIYSGIARGSVNGVLLAMPSDFHMSLAIGILIEGSTTVDGWETKNRGSESSYSGWTGAYSTFWGMTGLDLDWWRNDPYIRSHQAQSGAVIGTEGIEIYSNGWIEGKDRRSSLYPASLYSDQLAKRLARANPPTPPSTSPVEEPGPSTPPNSPNRRPDPDLGF